MSDKKIEVLEIAKSISAFASIVAKSIQNDLEDFNKISEIIKIKFILNDIIKKREKMGKKSSAKKARKEVEDFKIKENINSKELNEFEKIKKFQDLENVIITYGDNQKDKFKDFQKIYSLINNEIQAQDKKWIYSEKDNIYYILPYKFFVTERIIGYSWDYYEKNIEELYKFSNKVKEKNINFNFPNELDLLSLDDIGFLEEGRRWIYKGEENNENIFDYYYNFFIVLEGEEPENSLLGIFKINEFYIFLGNRNRTSNFKNNELKNFYSEIEEKKIDINKEFDFNELNDVIFELDEKVDNFFWKEVIEGELEEKDFFKEYQSSLLESNNLKNFEVILNYDLLDPSIITKEFEKSFNNLVEVYKTYKNYISCIYNKDDENIGILFDIDKITESIKDKKKVFDSIEIPYFPNELGIEREIVHLDRNIYYYKNGDIEEVYNENSGENKSIYYYKNGDIEEKKYQYGLLNGKSILNFSNGDVEERIYQNGVLDGNSILKLANGDIEERTYQNGVLNGKSILKSTTGQIEERTYQNGVLDGTSIYKNGDKKKAYCYTNGIKEEMPVLKYYLSIDKERINTDDYQEDILLDPNVGHWDLKEQDKKELKEILGKNVYKRNPKDDVNQGGIVAIDFGTKSTVVVYQKDSENILPMRISGDKLNREVRNTDYENPTVIEFRDINKFLKDYNAKVGRPDTKWQDITVSHTAFGNLTEVSSEYFDSIISDIKQWTASKNQKIILVDRKGKEILLPPYLELKEKSKDYLDPVEIYAYYIGSYINNMINGIYLEYYLSFPVTYEKAIRERILKSFEKGIQKSLPIEIQEDKDLMKKFRVRHGANEPAAFAVCALSKLEIEPKNEEDKVYYGVFDFGGGTTDFDFGIWKYSEEEDLYDYELEHFSAGGERYLGGENILKELAYKVFTNNSSNLRKNQIQYTRPEWCDEIIGEETLVSQTKQARQNSTKVAKELRGIWENTTTERVDFISVNLFDSHGEVNAGFKLNVKEDDLKNLIKEKIEKGIKNFFIKMEDAFKGEDVKEINIFLAGNSCKHLFVEEIFNSYIEKKKDKFKINIYDTKMFEKLKDTKKTNPTAKTGVAFGLIYSRNSGRIKVTSRDEKANINNEVNFKFYVGNNRRNKFNCIISPNSNYDEYKFSGIVKSDIFELYYSTSPEAQTNEMKSSEAKIKRVNLKKEYEEEDRYRIYLKANKSDELSYAIVKEEKDIETKKFVEEGEVTLN